MLIVTEPSITDARPDTYQPKKISVQLEWNTQGCKCERAQVFFLSPTSSVGASRFKPIWASNRYCFALHRRSGCWGCLNIVSKGDAIGVSLALKSSYS